VRKCEEAQKKRLKDFQERTLKLWAFEDEKKRKNKIFMERVVKEAHLIRNREEEEEEEERKKKKRKRKKRKKRKKPRKKKLGFNTHSRLSNRKRI